MAANRARRASVDLADRLPRAATFVWAAMPPAIFFPSTAVYNRYGAGFTRRSARRSSIVGVAPPSITETHLTSSGSAASLMVAKPKLPAEPPMLWES